MRRRASTTRAALFDAAGARAPVAHDGRHHALKCVCSHTRHCTRSARFAERMREGLLTFERQQRSHLHSPPRAGPSTPGASSCKLCVRVCRAFEGNWRTTSRCSRTFCFRLSSALSHPLTWMPRFAATSIRSARSSPCLAASASSAILVEPSDGALVAQSAIDHNAAYFSNVNCLSNARAVSNVLEWYLRSLLALCVARSSGVFAALLNRAKC